MNAANTAARNAAMNDPKVQGILNHAEAIFITGGDQYAYIECWKGTPVETIIQNRLAAGQIVLAGTSAGLAVLGQYDFTAKNLTSDNPDDDANELLGDEALRNDSEVTITNELFANIAPLAGVITDTHFGFPQRLRMGRLVAFLAVENAVGVKKGLGLMRPRQSSSLSKHSPIILAISARTTGYKSATPWSWVATPTSSLPPKPNSHLSERAHSSTAASVCARSDQVMGNSCLPTCGTRRSSSAPSTTSTPSVVTSLAPDKTTTSTSPRASLGTETFESCGRESPRWSNDRAGDALRAPISYSSHDNFNRHRE
jgi:Peptidase family S51